MIASVGPYVQGSCIDIGDDASQKQAGVPQNCPRQSENEIAKEGNECSAHAAGGKGTWSVMPCVGMRAHIFNACRLSSLLDHCSTVDQRPPNSPKRARAACGRRLRGATSALQRPSHSNYWVSSSNSHTPLLVRPLSIFCSGSVVNSKSTAHRSIVQCTVDVIASLFVADPHFYPPCVVSER